jgi:hypothetical protein
MLSHAHGIGLIWPRGWPPAKGPTKLKLLHVHNNMLGEGGAKSMAPIVAQSPQLEDFRFSTTCGDPTRP